VRRRLGVGRRRNARGWIYALIVAALVLVLILLALFALWPASGPSSGEGDQANEPTQEEESTVQDTTVGEPAGGAPGNVALRVSGTPGVTYEGTYNTRAEVQTVAGTVGDEPTDYDANVEGVDEATLSAVFRKTQPGGETLKVEIVSDNQVIAESATAAELGEVTVKWPSQDAPKGTTLPAERAGP
jgi:hypothetical protein